MGDRGWLGSVELRYAVTSWLVASVFHDHGAVTVNAHSYLDSSNSMHRKGSGLGLTGNYSDFDWRAYVAWRDGEEGGAGPVAKNIGPERAGAIKAQLGLKDGDAVFFTAGNPANFYKFAGAARDRAGDDAAAGPGHAREVARAPRWCAGAGRCTVMVAGPAAGASAGRLPFGHDAERILS